MTRNLHRVNETTVADARAEYVTVTQRDPLDDTRNHMVFLTRSELEALLAAMPA